VNALPVRSCLIDGEAIVTDDRGLAVFEMICNRRYEAATVLCAFDLIELDGEDLRRAPLELRTTLPAHAEPVDVCARYGGHRVNFMRGHHAMWRCDYPRHR